MYVATYVRAVRISVHSYNIHNYIYVYKNINVTDQASLHVQICHFRLSLGKTYTELTFTGLVKHFIIV